MHAAVRALALFLLSASAGPTLGAPAARGESFPMPASLVPRVEFWTRVYSEVGTHGGLIHDAADLSIVYEVVRGAEGSSERALNRSVEEARARARAALLRLAAGEREGLSAAERRVLALFPPGVSSRTLRAAADRVRFQRGQADKFRAGLQRMGRWESHIRRALRERGVPEDLKALPHVESSYNPAAHSHAGAAGLFQFTRPTGRLYMRVDHVVDERRDPFVAAEAAARLLRGNYERLGAWPLAITAYNHGPGGMAKAVRQLGTRDIGTIVARYQSPSFGFASRNFYCEFLAARRIDQSPERYFGPIQKEAPWDHESVVLRQSYGVHVLAKALRLPTEELRDWNPALLAPVWSGSRSVPASYELRVPRRADHPPASQLVAGIQGQGYQGAPAAARAAEPGGGRHRVLAGETLGEIARSYGTSSAELAELNGIENPRRLRAGQILELPGAPAAAPSAPAQASEVAGAGEVDASAARAEPQASEASASAARSEPQASEASASAARSEPQASEASRASGAIVHRVGRGETLLEIAHRYGVGMAKIAALNDIRDPRELREGQTLEIPVAAATPGPGPEPAPQVARAEPAAAPPEAVPASAPAEAEAEAAAPAPPEPAAEPATPRTYTIAPGDSFRTLAPRLGVGVRELVDANPGADPRRLRPGQSIVIPAGAAQAPEAEPSAQAATPAPPPAAPTPATTAAATSPAPEPAALRTYTIASGDTLGSVARRFGVDERQLAAANGEPDPRRLRPGQVLELPTGADPGAAAPPAPAPERVYTVREGDTLYSIASRHGLSVAAIAELNGLRNRHRLSIGQRLRLPPERGA